MIKFEMIGKLSANKDSDKFKSYEEKELGSKGWIQRIYRFGVTSGNNHFFLQSQGGKFKDESNKIYVFGKGTVDEDGNRKKGEMFTIDFKDRLTDKRLNEIADFKKFVFDTEKPGRRWRLKQALEKFEEGTKLDKEELDDLGVKSMDDLKSEVALSEKRRKEFISAWDYAEYIKKVIDSEKYKDSKFHIYGEYEFQYSEAKGTFYKNYVPQKIYLADQSEEDCATATVDFYYNEASLDTTSLVDTNKYYVNGYVRVYDNSRKSDIPAPYTIVIPAAKNESDLEKKREKKQVSRFEVTDGMWYNYGIVVELLNGSQAEEIKFEDLTEEQQDSILLGELTLEDIQKEMGNYVYGERITENRFLKPAKGFSKGRQETVYTDEDFEINSLDDENAFEEAEEDLFDDDDIL